MSALQRVDWHAIAPLVALAGGAILVLLADLFVPARRRARTAALLASAAVVAAIGFEVSIWSTPRRTFCLTGSTCSYVVDRYAVTMSLVILVCALAVVWQGLLAVRRDRIPAGEYHHLLLAATAGAVALGSTRDLLTLIVALETLAVPSFVLVGLRRDDARGSEGAMIYFLFSVLGTAVTLYGVSLIYGVTGSLDYSRIAAGLAAPRIEGSLPQAAVVLVLTGFLVKVSAVPFHAWAPAAYDGAPLPVAAYLATVSKVGGFAGLVPLLRQAFEPEAHMWGLLIGVVSVASMVVGSLIALRQTRVIRLLAWSSIAQAGFGLAPLAVAAWRPGTLPRAQSALITYVAIYALTATAAFAAIAATRVENPSFEDLRGWIVRQRWVAITLGMSLFALAGAPPGFSGLWAKITVMRSLLDGHTLWVAMVVAVATVLSLAYYLRLALVIFAHPTQGHARVPPGRAAALTGYVALIAIVVVSVVPGVILHFADRALTLAP